MTTGSIRYGWDRPVPLPLDFAFSPTFTERTTVADKKEGLTDHTAIGVYGGGIGTVITSPAYFVFVWTSRGDLRISVSKAVFDQIRTGDSVVVQYQQGRWTNSLKGCIAR